MLVRALGPLRVKMPTGSVDLLPGQTIELTDALGEKLLRLAPAGLVELAQRVATPMGTNPPQTKLPQSDLARRTLEQLSAPKESTPRPQASACEGTARKEGAPCQVGASVSYQVPLIEGEGPNHIKKKIVSFGLNTPLNDREVVKALRWKYSKCPSCGTKALWRIGSKFCLACIEWRPLKPVLKKHRQQVFNKKEEPKNATTGKQGSGP